MAENLPRVCIGCGLKTVVGATPFCSRRCAWSVDTCCPQCGRWRNPSFPYCSPQCSEQALQANWCPCCGTCQLTLAGYCSNALCHGAQRGLASFQPAKKRKSALRHELLSLNDPQAQPVLAIVSQIKSSLRVQVIKIDHQSSHRRLYLSYRSNIETAMTARGEEKFGHGGEGNEQRRFLPLRSQCDATTLSGCDEPSCEACVMLKHGVNMQKMNRMFHLAFSSLQATLQWCSHNSASERHAILMARVVVGSPNLMVDATSEGSADQHRDFDSVIVNASDPTFSTTYLYHDEAIDPLFLLTLGTM